ncbi:Argonaute family protein [Rhynchospora pubera]|uniref:Argonaute family protein n=1 Tax=Rhynchospora pubera TaxID=906938 RepID=A0AAV8CJE1_9POAL|nr:Argonaute family protein [Rhynchospora pubera]
MEKAKKGSYKHVKKHSPLAVGAHQNGMPLMEIPPIIQNGYPYPYQYRYHQSCPALLPLPLSLPLPPPLLVYVPPAAPLFHDNNHLKWRTNGQNCLRKQRPVQNQVLGPGPTETRFNALPLHQELELPQNQTNIQNRISHLDLSGKVVVATRPDSGGTEGPAIPLLANHFLVQFDPSERIFHYDVNITPRPSKETARMIKHKLVEENRDLLSGVMPVFDGRKNLYSPIEFQRDKLEFHISLPIPTNGGKLMETQKKRLFRVNIRLVSKLTGENLNKYLKEKDGSIPLPQDYLHALDIVLREGPSESCISVGRSLYTCSMGGQRDIGGGVVGMRGFFQSLRPTQQGLSLNLDFSVAAFHESIGIIPYLQKKCSFLTDDFLKKQRALTEEERKQVQSALKNVKIFVCHRDTHQRFRVYSLTEGATKDLKFWDRSGKEYKLVDYFRDQYNYEIEFKNLPCLQISRSKPCYLPMELCTICEGQKFLGKLSDEQTAKILKMNCQRPDERKDIINNVVKGAFGPASGSYSNQFSLQISKEMTQLVGRVLQPPKLKFGDTGHVRDMTPSRHDRQWNFLHSHVAEGSTIRRWAVISFGGTSAQHACIPTFIHQLSNRCEHLGILLSKNTMVNPLFENIQLLNNITGLETKLRKINEAANGNLQLLVCVMERRHKGYADLKRIAETSIGVVTQCCLYQNLTKLTSQFLANLALKINAKLGGCNMVLYNSLPHQIPRIFFDNQPAIFMGADVTHPHPLDDVSPSIVAVVGSMNWPASNRYISRMRSQTHRQEIIENLDLMVYELLDEFLLENKKLPSKIIFFRDGVSETQFQKVLKEELQAIRVACKRFEGYQPLVTFIVVQKRHHTRLFHGDQNVPPGTVVDTVITHPREFDFYLCSHSGTKGTSRPTHYHVLWDENRFRSDEMQKLVHCLCYTFVRCTKPVSLVPPAYYAHLAAYRGRLYLERSDSGACGKQMLYRSGPLQTAPLPQLQDTVKKLMFYC